jgi:hypothetical protein
MLFTPSGGSTSPQVITCFFQRSEALRAEALQRLRNSVEDQCIREFNLLDSSIVGMESSPML